ncbi:MAG: biotin/lipoyl-binding protein [Planctomycetaceae bacterium]|nr:biotin/lipoyl-binding protein [Planctomycetaceae bacterium]
MSSAPSVHELRCQRFKLADGVVASAQQHRGRAGYHLQHPSRTEFFHVSDHEAALLSLMDGRRTFAAVISITARTLGADAFSEEVATELCLRLLKAGLLTIAGNSETLRSAGENSSRRAGGWNPFWMQFPLFNPDGLLQALLVVCRWVFHPAAVVGSLVVTGWAGSVLWTDWDRFASSGAQVFSPDNWIWLGLAWLCLKVIHELAHGLACRYYGGDVSKLGVVLVLFAPMAYVDVTSSWNLRSRWQRMHIAAAGMWAELTIAAVAVLIWSHTESVRTAHLLHNVIVMAGVTTLLFNLNPLMRFDGYYLLSDALGIPNLAGRGAAAVQQLLRRCLFGERFPASTSDGHERMLVLLYGVSASLWRVVVSVGLTIAAAVMWHGAGIVLALLGMILWWGLPLLRGFAAVRTVAQQSPAAAGRGLVVGAMAVAAVVAPLSLLPNPRGTSAPGIVDYADARHIRAAAEGFLERIHVGDGQRVEAGDLLFELSNDELTNELIDLEIEWQESEVRRLAAVNAGKLGEAQIELGQQAAIEERLREREQKCGSAPRSPVLSSPAGCRSAFTPL